MEPGGYRCPDLEKRRYPRCTRQSDCRGTAGDSPGHQADEGIPVAVDDLGRQLANAEFRRTHHVAAKAAAMNGDPSAGDGGQRVHGRDTGT